MASRRLRLHTTALLLGGAVALSGCSGSSAPTPTPSQTATSASPSPTLGPFQQLDNLIVRGNKTVLRATYLVRQKHPSSRATWRVWRTSKSLRVDVVTRRATATLIQTTHNTFACSRSGHSKRCFRVAAGGSLPAGLRLLAARLFSTDMATLANGGRITIGTPTTAGRFGTCFDVTPHLHNSTLEKANYCFDDNGILTRVRYPNGNLVQAQQIATQSPTGKVFQPYSSPTPLPG